MSMASHQNGATNGTKAVKSVFLAHPNHTDVSVIRHVLEREGVTVRSDEYLEVGESMQGSMFDSMQKADAVIVVLGNAQENANVYYQLGLAEGMRKPVLVLSASTSDPFNRMGLYPYLRARIDDEDALRFGLSHFVRVRHQAATAKPAHVAETKPLGEKVDVFLARLRSGNLVREDELVAMIAAAIRESGVEAQASVSTNHSTAEIPADIAVWSDELESLVGNPLPIEVCASLLTANDAEHASKNLMRAMVGAQVRWGLILFLRATPTASNALINRSVLSMAIEDFLEGLRTRSFGRIVAGLRTRAVHGVSANA